MMLMKTFHIDLVSKCFNNKMIINMTESKFLVDFEYDLVQNREFEKPVEHPIFLNKLLVQNRGLFTSSAS